jgi:hypothetical protein
MLANIQEIRSHRRHFRSSGLADVEVHYGLRRVRWRGYQRGHAGCFRG